jgi:hypothetical protein
VSEDTTDRELRAQINDLVRARQRAESEAARITDRAQLPGAEPGLAGIAERYRSQAAELAEEIEALRTLLRTHEAEAEARRADDAGA